MGTDQGFFKSLKAKRLLPRNLAPRFWSTLSENWSLGFTSFGGPPVHFKIVRLAKAALKVKGGMSC